jgi:hypothetical protein
MRTLVVLILLGFWIFLANRAYQRGDLALAGVYALVGVALTAYRFRAAPRG